MQNLNARNSGQVTRGLDPAVPLVTAGEDGARVCAEIDPCGRGTINRPGLRQDREEAGFLRQPVAQCLPAFAAIA